MSTIGIVGTGQVGSAVARVAVGNGHRVLVSNSRGPQTLGDIVRLLGPSAVAAEVAEAVRSADLVLLATPVRSHLDLAPCVFAGKIVLDATNYYPARDGDVPELLNGSTTSSRRLQAHLAEARIVKALNIINASELMSTATPRGAAGRRALPIAGDDPAAKALVAGFIDELGFDVVDIGALEESWRIGPGTPGYIVHSTTADLIERVAAAAPPAS